MEQLKRLFGKDFPVLPQLRASALTRREFNASLADQGALTIANAWRINGLVDANRAGSRRRRCFAAVLAAHEALCAPLARGRSEGRAVPARSGREWAALPEAWQHPEGTPSDPKQVPEELREYLAARPGAPYRDINDVAPDLAIALHAPGVDAIAPDQTIAAFVCDEWPEFVPIRSRPQAIGFHYDAPGARPPQTFSSRCRHNSARTTWSFDDAVDVIHEAFDLAKLRGVRPCDLAGGLGAILPGNFLPHSYTDDLPSVRVLGMMGQARERLVSSRRDRKVHPRQDLRARRQHARRD